MRTAQEILKKKRKYISSAEVPDYLHDIVPYSDAIKLINEARKEAIEECAKVATSVPYKIQGLEYHLNNFIDKQSILDLIKQLQ